MFFDSVKGERPLCEEVVFGCKKRVREFSDNLFCQKVLVDVKVGGNANFQTNGGHIC